MNAWRLDAKLKPWELYAAHDFKPSEEAIIESWAPFLPKDFYFACAPFTDDITLVCLVPIAYFNKHQNLFPDSMAIVHILPRYLYETFEGLYEVERKKSEVFRDLAQKGFVWSREFQVWFDKEMAELDTDKQEVNGISN